MVKDPDILFIAQNALEIFTRLRWPDGPVCPVCGCHHYYTTSRGLFICKHCHKHYSIKTGSILHSSKIPVEKWLLSLYFLITSKGLSSLELSRRLSVTQKTAYYILLKLRYSITQDDTIFNDEEVAMDEVYLGGTWRCFSNKKKRELLERYRLPRTQRTPSEKMAVAQEVNRRYKTPVYGIVSENSIYLKTLQNDFEQCILVDLFKKHTRGTGVAVSDCGTEYANWESLTGWSNEQNNHSIGQFTTETGRSSNRIEGEFAWVKREFLNSYVHLSKKHLQAYLNEFAFKYNTRKQKLEDRLNSAILRLGQKMTQCTLRRIPKPDDKIYFDDGFDPETFFKTCGCFVLEVKRRGLVYRREDYVS